MKTITGSEIIMYENKLCEVIGYSNGQKVVYLRVLRNEDKKKCLKCGEPQETDFDVIEGCRNWESGAKPVKTL